MNKDRVEPKQCITEMYQILVAVNEFWTLLLKKKLFFDSFRFTAGQNICAGLKVKEDKAIN